MLPLTFPEYAAAHSAEPKASSAGTVSALFERYPETGGVPRSINGDERFLEDFSASVERDAVKAGRDPRLLKLVARELLAKAPSR